MLGLTASAIFGFLLESGASAIAGGKIDSAANKFLIGPVMDRLQKKTDIGQELPLNQHLALTIKQATIFTNSVLFHTYIQDNENAEILGNSWEFNGFSLDSLSATFQVYLSDEEAITAVQYASLQEDPTYGKLEGLLADARTNDEYISVFREKLSLEVKEKLIGDLKKVPALIVLPPGLEDMIRNGWIVNGVRVDWFKLMASKFAELLQEAEMRPVLIAFQNRLLSDIKLDTELLKTDLVSAFSLSSQQMQATLEEGLLIGRRTEEKLNSLVDLYLEDRTNAVPTIKDKYLTKVRNYGRELIGREIEMHNLTDKLSSGLSPVLVNGIWGIGKSLLTSTYLKNNHDNYDHVIYLDLRSIDNYASREVFIENLGTDSVLNKNFIASHQAHLSISQRAELILQDIRNLQGKNLLIIDNIGHDLGSVLPMLPMTDNWHITFSSQININEHNPVTLTGISPTDARKLFAKFFPIAYDEIELDNLIQELDHHPLMIELAARTLMQSAGLLTISQFTKIIKEQQPDELSYNESLNIDGAEQVLIKHILRTFNLVSLTNEETDMLMRFYLLPEESFTIQTLFQLYGVQLKDQRSFKNTMVVLYTKGWLSMVDMNFSLEGLIRKVLNLTASSAGLRPLAITLATSLLKQH